MVNSSVDRAITPRATQTMAVQCARCGHLASRMNGPRCFFCGAELSPSSATSTRPPARHDVAFVTASATSATPRATHPRPTDRLSAHEVITAPPAGPRFSPAPAQRPATREVYNSFAGAALLLGFMSIGITVAAAAIGYYIFGFFSVYAVLIALRGIVRGISIRPHRGMLVSLLGLILSGLALAATLLMAEGQIVIYY